MSCNTNLIPCAVSFNYAAYLCNCKNTGQYGQLPHSLCQSGCCDGSKVPTTAREAELKCRMAKIVDALIKFNEGIEKFQAIKDVVAVKQPLLFEVTKYFEEKERNGTEIIGKHIELNGIYSDIEDTFITLTLGDNYHVTELFTEVKNAISRYNYSARQYW